MARSLVIKHGTITGYKFHGCKCKLCRAKNTEVEQNRQKRNRKRLLESLKLSEGV